jgi:hypothetical protein
MTLEELTAKIPAHMDPKDPNIQVMYGIVENGEFLGLAIDQHKRQSTPLKTILEGSADFCIIEQLRTPDVEQAIKFVFKYMKVKQNRIWSQHGKIKNSKHGGHPQ